MSDLVEQAKKYLEASMGFDEETIEAIVEMARQNLDSGMNEVETAVASSNAGEASRCAHTLKGNLLNIGLNDAAELARKIELTAKGGSLDGLAECIGRLRGLINEFCN